METKKYYAFKIQAEDLESHVKRICKRNLQNKTIFKCCQGCPFLETIAEIMEDKGWKYNKAGVEEILQERKPYK